MYKALGPQNFRLERNLNLWNYIIFIKTSFHKIFTFSHVLDFSVLNLHFITIICRFLKAFRTESLVADSLCHLRYYRRLDYGSVTLVKYE